MLGRGAPLLELHGDLDGGAGNDMVINGKIVADTPNKNEKMPNGVMKMKLFPGEKNQTKTVEQAARQKELEPCLRNQLDRGLDGQDEQPTHKEVDQRRQNLESMDGKKLEKYAQDGQPPHHAEQRPAPVASQINQGKRSVCSCDEEIYCRVVEDLENLSPALMKFENMIKGKRRVGDDETRSVDGATYDMPAISVTDCLVDQNNQSWQAQEEADSRSESVGNWGRFVIALVHRAV